MITHGRYAEPFWLGGVVLAVVAAALAVAGDRHQGPGAHRARRDRRAGRAAGLRVRLRARGPGRRRSPDAAQPTVGGPNRMTETVPDRAASRRPPRPPPASHVLPGARTHEHLHNYPPVADVGRPRRVRRQGAPAQGAAPLHAGADDLLQLRVRLRPAGLRRPATTCRCKRSRATPPTRARAGRNCAKGPATINQVNDPERILHPLRRVGERGDGQWERVTLGRRARRHRRPDPHGDRRGPPRRGRLPRRPARRGRLRRAGAAGLGRRRTQQPHQRLLVRRPGWATTLWGATTGRRPTTPTPRSSSCSPATWRPGTTSTRTPSGSWRASRPAPSSSCVDPRLSNTACHADLWIAPVARQRGRDPARRRVLPAAHPARSTETFLRRWVNWDVYLRERHPIRARRRSRRSSTRSKRTTREYTFDVRRARRPRCPSSRSRRLARLVATAGAAARAHIWRSAAAGNLGGWQVARALWFVLAC